MSMSRRSVGVYQPRSRRAAFSDALSTLRAYVLQLLSEAFRRTLGLALMITAAALLAALGSYDTADPSFDNASARETTNWL